MPESVIPRASVSAAAMCVPQDPAPMTAVLMSVLRERGIGVLALHRPGSQSLDELTLERREQHDHRHAQDQHRSRDQLPR
jgi:hypothetical protein